MPFSCNEGIFKSFKLLQFSWRNQIIFRVDDLHGVAFEYRIHN